MPRELDACALKKIINPYNSIILTNISLGYLKKIVQYCEMIHEIRKKNSFDFDKECEYLVFIIHSVRSDDC